MSKPALIAAIVLICAVGAVVVDRLMFWPTPNDALAQAHAALEAQLARSEAVRDSLQQQIDLRRDTLIVLRQRADSLTRTLAQSEGARLRQGRVITDLRRNPFRYEHSPDTLLRDVNRIFDRARARAADPPGGDD